jgi:hypothetical protein
MKRKIITNSQSCCDSLSKNFTEFVAKYLTEINNGQSIQKCRILMQIQS